MIFLIIGTASFLAGLAVEWTRSRNLRKATVRATARHELRMQFTSPIDLSLCQVTGRWQARG